MPTLRNIFTKTFSSIVKVIKKIFNLSNWILDLELDNNGSKINWFYTLSFFFLLGFNIYWFFIIKTYQEFLDVFIIPASIFPIFFGMCSLYLSYYYFRHAKNKTKSKGKKYSLIILVIFLILEANGYAIMEDIIYGDSY